MQLKDLVTTLGLCRDKAAAIDKAIPGPDASTAWFEGALSIAGSAMRVLAREQGFVVVTPPLSHDDTSDVDAADKAGMERLLHLPMSTELGQESGRYAQLLADYLDGIEPVMHEGGIESTEGEEAPPA